MKTGNRRQAICNCRKSSVFSLALFAMLFALFFSAQAQQPGKVYRVGFLDFRSRSTTTDPRFVTFRQGLRELGYIERAHALIVVRNPLTASHRARIVDFAVKSRLPAIYPDGEFVDAGGLMSYGVNVPDLWGRAAVYVDKILKGANPAGLPVEQPTKFEFIVNLKTAKQIGLTIPPNVLARADRVIR